MTIEPCVDDGPGRDCTGCGGEGTPFGIDLPGFVIGCVDVAVRVDDLRIGGVAHGIPIDTWTVLHCVADHCIAHVACPAKTLQFVKIGRVVECKEVCGHYRSLLVASPNFRLGVGARNTRCIDAREIWSDSGESGLAKSLYGSLFTAGASAPTSP